MEIEDKFFSDQGDLNKEDQMMNDIDMVRFVRTHLCFCGKGLKMMWSRETSGYILECALGHHPDPSQCVYQMEMTLLEHEAAATMAGKHVGRRSVAHDMEALFGNRRS